MVQFDRMRWFSLLLVAGIAVISLTLSTFVQAQFNDDRRRTDLSPISLPGGSTIEFKSFDSQSLGMSERYSVFLPPPMPRIPPAHTQCSISFTA